MASYLYNANYPNYSDNSCDSFDSDDFNNESYNDYGEYDIDGSFKCTCFCEIQDMCICITNSIANENECFDNNKTCNLPLPDIDDNISMTITVETDDKGNKFRRRKLVAKKEVLDYFTQKYKDTIKKCVTTNGLGVIYKNNYFPFNIEDQTYNPMHLFSCIKFKEGIVLCEYKLVNDKTIYNFTYYNKDSHTFSNT